MEAEVLHFTVVLSMNYTSNSRDTLHRKMILEGRGNSPWHLITVEDDIQDLMRNCNVHLQHTYIEGNMMTDFLANLALDIRDKLEFRSFQELPVTGRRLLNMDKMQFTNLRIEMKNSMIDTTFIAFWIYWIDTATGD